MCAQYPAIHFKLRPYAPQWIISPTPLTLIKTAFEGGDGGDCSMQYCYHSQLGRGGLQNAGSTLEVVLQGLDQYILHYGLQKDKQAKEHQLQTTTQKKHCF